MSDIVKELIKTYGKGVIIDAEFLSESEKKIIPVTTSTDMAIGGGIPEGCWVILSGPEKCGKTSLALQISANAQNLYNKRIFYINAEGRLDKLTLNNIKGLNKKEIEVIQSVKGKILSAEDFLSATMRIIKNEPECVVIIDSASSLCSQKELTDELKSQTRNDGPKLLASFCRQMGTVVPVQKTIIILIQHLIANTSGYGHPYVEDGGQKIKYQSDVKLRCKGFKKWEIKDKRIGQISEWEVVKSALSAPGAKYQTYLRYNYGFDNAMEIVNVASDLGLINKSGAWYSIEGDEQQFQGKENLRDYLTDDKHGQKLFLEIEAKIKEMIS